MPGIGEEMEGAMQQAPQALRQENAVMMKNTQKRLSSRFAAYDNIAIDNSKSGNSRQMHGAANYNTDFM